MKCSLLKVLNANFVEVLSPNRTSGLIQLSVKNTMQNKMCICNELVVAILGLLYSTDWMLEHSYSLKFFPPSLRFCAPVLYWMLDGITVQLPMYGRAETFICQIRKLFAWNLFGYIAEAEEFKKFKIKFKKWLFNLKTNKPWRTTVFCPLGDLRASWSKVMICPPAFKILPRAVSVTCNAHTWNSQWNMLELNFF